MKSEQFWDKQSQRPDKIDKRFEKANAGIVKKTQQCLTKDGTVLDFACGRGRITAAVAPLVKKVYAIDTSSGMLSAARKKITDKNVQFLHTDIFDSRLKKGSFDAVLAFNILHLVENGEGVVQRIHELLKPGGFFISTTPCTKEGQSWWSIVFFVFSKLGMFPYARGFSFSALKGLLADSFKIVETETMDYNPPIYFIISQKK